MTPIPSRSAYGRISFSTSRSMSEYGGCSVSTGAADWMRRSCSALKSGTAASTTTPSPGTRLRYYCAIPSRPRVMGRDLRPQRPVGGGEQHEQRPGVGVGARAGEYAAEVLADHPDRQVGDHGQGQGRAGGRGEEYPGRDEDLDFRRSWGLGRCCGPGCGDGTDFVVGGLAWDGSGKPGRDDDPAELDEHVLEGRLGLVAVPRLVVAAGVDVGGVVAVPGVPHHDQGVHCSANGTVRSTASRLRLRASPAPRTSRASANACSTDHLI